MRVLCVCRSNVFLWVYYLTIIHGRIQNFFEQFSLVSQFFQNISKISFFFQMGVKNNEEGLTEQQLTRRM
jgi:hypothetical protein